MLNPSSSIHCWRIAVITAFILWSVHHLPSIFFLMLWFYRVSLFWQRNGLPSTQSWIICHLPEFWNPWYLYLYLYFDFSKTIHLGIKVYLIKQMRSIKIKHPICDSDYVKYLIFKADIENFNSILTKWK